MKKEFLHIDDYKILIEDGFQKEDSIIQLPDDTVGIVYYLSGEVVVAIEESGQTATFSKSKGMMSSFFASNANTIIQKQNLDKKLTKISIFFPKEKLKELVGDDEQLQGIENVQNLIYPQDHFVQGLKGAINPFSIQTLQNILSTRFTGTPKEMLIEAQIITLLSDYLNLNAQTKIEQPNAQLDKLYYAKEILLEQMDAPPSLTELAKLTALNTYSLKTGFKELFGQPVFKFLQNKRLDKAFELLENKDMTVQEVAWFVGYNSLGSFSNAFKNKFGIRPNDLSN